MFRQVSEPSETCITHIESGRLDHVSILRQSIFVTVEPSDSFVLSRTVLEDRINVNSPFTSSIEVMSPTSAFAIIVLRSNILPYKLCLRRT